MTSTEAHAGQDDSTAEAVSPEPILRLASGFMAAKHLFAASELGIFGALADAPATLDALAARTGLTRRAARISADAMVALGLIELDGDRYRNRPAAAQYLAGGTVGDLRPLLRFWDTISYPSWQALAEALGSGPPRQVFDLDEAQQEIVSAGIEAILAGPAHALPEVRPFRQPKVARCRRRQRLMVDRRGQAPPTPARHGLRAARDRSDRPGPHHRGRHGGPGGRGGR